MSTQQEELNRSHLLRTLQSKVRRDRRQDEDDLGFWGIIGVIIGVFAFAPLFWILFLGVFSFWLWILGLGESTFLETLRETLKSSIFP